MLKIQRVAHDGVVVFILSGRIEGEQIAELQRLFACDAADQRLVLDLQRSSSWIKPPCDFWRLRSGRHAAR